MIKEVLAQGTNINLGSVRTTGIAGGTELTKIISNAVTILITIAVVAVLFMLIFGAFEWIISGGDKEKVANARNRITHALIGLVILGLAFVIVKVVGSIIGVDVMSNLLIPKLSD